MTKTKDKIENIWKCSECKGVFTDSQSDAQRDDRCPLCFTAFEQMPYEAPHLIARKDLVTSEKDEIRYIVILAQIVTMGEFGKQFSIAYDWDEESFTTHKEAIKHGFKTRGSDDFNIGKIINDNLLGFYWMNKLLQNYNLKEIAEQIGLENK